MGKKQTKITKKIYDFRPEDEERLEALKENLAIPTQVGVIRFILKQAYDYNVKKIRRP